MIEWLYKTTKIEDLKKIAQCVCRLYYRKKKDWSTPGNFQGAFAFLKNCFDFFFSIFSPQYNNTKNYIESCVSVCTYLFILCACLFVSPCGSMEGNSIWLMEFTLGKEFPFPLLPRFHSSMQNIVGDNRKEPLGKNIIFSSLFLLSIFLFRVVSSSSSSWYVCKLFYFIAFLEL